MEEISKGEMLLKTGQMAVQIMREFQVRYVPCHAPLITCLYVFAALHFGHTLCMLHLFACFLFLAPAACDGTPRSAVLKRVCMLKG